MRIAMIGGGYVGLVTAACLSDFGHEVVCVDKDSARIAVLQRAEVPIYEPGLSEIVANNLRGAAPAMIASILSPVPTGTVDLVMTTESSSR